MATGSMVPYSNPAGNNQTTPGVGVGGVRPIDIPGSPTTSTTTNPFTPLGATLNTGSTTSVPTAPYVPNVGGLTNSPTNVAGTTGAQQKQLVDIAGKGIGGDINNLLNNMSGTDSVILQQYEASLVPQEAKAQANVNATLGASGVSGNSSVTGIADANLQAQETAAIAGESANLIQSQEQMTAQILLGLEPSAQKEVATSGWSVFGDVMNQITGDVGNIVSGSDFTTKGNAPNAGLSSAGYAPGMGADVNLANTVPVDPMILGG